MKYVAMAMLVMGWGCSIQETVKLEKKPLADLAQPLRTGQEFEIALDSNPTTGAMWTMKTAPDPKVVQDLGNIYEGHPNPQKLAGRGGVQRWTFKAVGAGKTAFQLRYGRVVESEMDTFKDFTVEVK